MKLENMFKKTKIISRIQSHSSVHGPRPEVPEGLLRKCNKCGAAIIAEEVKRDGYICPKCGGDVEDEDNYCIHCGAPIIRR